MSTRDDIDRLFDAVRSLEDRVRALENPDDDAPDRIGFDVDENEGSDFDEDDSEYRRAK